MTTRNTSRHPGRKQSFESLKDFLAADLRDGYFTINYNGKPLDVLVEPVEGATTTLVSIHPAVTNPKVTRPYFIGSTLYAGLNSHRVYLSDPSLELDDDLTLGWFAGNQLQPDMQEAFTNILGHIQGNLDATSMIFVGASGGGFASLYYSAKFPGSLAIVTNPQTDILRYTRYLVMRYAKKAWNIHTWEKASQELPKRINSSVLDEYSSKSENSVIYMQNLTDRTHVEEQLKPFLEVLPEDNNVSLILGNDWAKGHQPAPREMQLRVVQSAVDCEGNWDTLRQAIPKLMPADEITTQDLIDPSEKEMTTNKLKVFIYGSCVSRDTAEFRPEDWERSRYVARQSLISAANPPQSLPQRPGLNSAFQNSAVEGDFQSSLFTEIESHASRADRIVIDLVDERMGVYPYANGSFLTYSNELGQSGLMNKMKGRGAFIEFGTEEHFLLWKAAAQKLLSLLDGLGVKEKVRVIESPFVDFTVEGAQVNQTRGKDAETWNSLYRRYYDFLEESGLDIVRIPEEHVISSAGHKWGPAQYHYVDGAYESLAVQIEA